MATKYTIQKEVFSDRLKTLMGTKDETTYSLGDVLNLSAATISRYADGKMSPKITTIYSMANHFNVNPVWLMGYDVPKKLELKEEPPCTITEDEMSLLANYNKLNNLGKQEAIKRVSELTEIPKYSLEKEYIPQTIAAHADGLTEEENNRNIAMVTEFMKKKK